MVLHSQVKIVNTHVRSAMLALESLFSPKFAALCLLMIYHLLIHTLLAYMGYA